MAKYKPAPHPTIYVVCAYNYLYRYHTATTTELSTEHKGMNRASFYVALSRLQEAGLVKVTTGSGANGKGQVGHYSLTAKGFKKARSVLSSLHFFD